MSALSSLTFKILLTMNLQYKNLLPQVVGTHVTYIYTIYCSNFKKKFRATQFQLRFQGK